MAKRKTYKTKSAARRAKRIRGCKSIYRVKGGWRVSRKRHKRARHRRR